MNASMGLLLGLLSLRAMAVDVHVDNVRGDDTNPGSREKPVKTISKGLELLKGGDTLHLTPNREPYRESVRIVGRHRYSGTAERRTVVDGHGALFDWRVPFPASAWKAQGNGVFSKKLRNNAHVMDRRLGCWSGEFPIVFFDGKDGVNCLKKEELKPFAYFLLKIPLKKGQKDRDPLHNTLYIKLPEGQTPNDIEVESLEDAKIDVEVDYVTVKNIRAQYTGGDCFDTAWGQHIVFDNVEGAYAMDQGISHHGSEVTVRNSRFHHNAGCGIVDVNMGESNCRSRYVNCVIEQNGYRGGIELLGYEHALDNCIIRHNGPGKTLAVGRKAKVKISNCVFIGPKEPATGSNGIDVGSETQLEMTHSTVYNFKVGLSLGISKTACRAVLSNNAFIDCGIAYSFGAPRDSTAEIDLNSNYNYFAPGKFGVDRIAVESEEYRQQKGQDADSVVSERYEGTLPPYRIESDRIGGLRNVGAVCADR